MALLTRRTGLAAAGVTLAAALVARKLVSDRTASPDAGQVDMQPLGAIVPRHPPSALPPIALYSLDGMATGLKAYAGRRVLLNFWATWCVPCVAELPALDRLAAADPGLAVLAVATDRAGAAVVGPFLVAHRISHLTVLLDSRNDAVHALGVAGFPTTLLIGVDGKLRGTLEGPAAWDTAGPDLRALLASA